MADHHSFVPSWEEMSYVKDLFWDAHECVVQFHPPKSVYVNINVNVLHLWMDTRTPFRLPPTDCV